MIYLTRKETFNAAHRIYVEEWSDEKNLEVFGKCSNPNWHGHNYTLFVTVKGTVDLQTGFVINLKTLSKIINEKIIEKMDHRNINLEVEFMHGIRATTENITIAIWNELNDELKSYKAKLHCVKLFETENNFVEYYG